MVKSHWKSKIFSNRFAAQSSPILLKNSQILNDVVEIDFNYPRFCRFFPANRNFRDTKTQQKEVLWFTCRPACSWENNSILCGIGLRPSRTTRTPTTSRIWSLSLTRIFLQICYTFFVTCVHVLIEIYGFVRLAPSLCAEVARVQRHICLQNHSRPFVIQKNVSAFTVSENLK